MPLTQQPKPHPQTGGNLPPDIIYRHPLYVRLWHWVNALSLILLLMSGLQIFNYHPALYWGESGYYGLPSFLSIQGPAADAEDDVSILQIGPYEFDVTGLLGVKLEQNERVRTFAIPPALTLPTTRSLALGRDWHFLMAWVFVLSGLAYVLSGMVSGYFRRRFVPSKSQLGWRSIAHELWLHLRFRPHRGEAMRHYNLLQKISYALVVFVLLPAMVLSGLTMSNGFTAVFPQLFDLFGGRQSARTIHFITAFALVLFVLVHVIQVFVAGFINEMRSMITGRFKILQEKKR